MENISDYLQNNSSLNIIVDAHNYNIQDDRRFLVPFMIYEHNDIHFGFADRNGKIVIPAIYDKVFDNFNSVTDLVRVGKRFIIDYGTKEKPRQYKYFYCGVINAQGKELIPCDKYRELYFAGENLLIAHGNRMKKECALIDMNGNEIIPYYRFKIIYHFVNGFARVWSMDGKWGIIDKSGDLLIEGGEVDWIWDLSNGYPHIVVEKNKRKYQIPFETLQKRQNELATQGIIITPIEECLIYQEYLQKDFTKASSIELGEIYF